MVDEQSETGHARATKEFLTLLKFRKINYVDIAYFPS